MASVVGEREIDLSKLSIEQLNQLKTQLSEVRLSSITPRAETSCLPACLPALLTYFPLAPTTTPHHPLCRKWTR